MLRTACIRTFSYRRGKGGIVQERGKIWLYMLFHIHVHSTVCILKSLEPNISSFFVLGYGDEYLVGLWVFLFISFKITAPE